MKKEFGASTRIILHNRESTVYHKMSSIIKYKLYRDLYNYRSFISSDGFAITCLRTSIARLCCFEAVGQLLQLCTLLLIALLGCIVISERDQALSK